jgi:hypothetical protein
MHRIRIEKPTNHALVLRVVLARLALEELNAAFAQRQGHLDAFLSKDDPPRKKIRNA